MKNDPALLNVVQWGIWFVVMTLVMRRLARSRMRSVTDGGIALLRHPVSTLIVGVVGAAGFGALAILVAMHPGRGNSPLISLLFLVFAALGAVITIEYFRVCHRLEPEGLRYQTLRGKRGLLAWPDTARLSYSPSMKWFRLEGRRGEVVRVSAMLTSLPDFARAVLKHVPAGKIESSTRNVLERTANGRPPSIWTKG